MPATDYHFGSTANFVDFTGNVQIDALIVGAVWGSGIVGTAQNVSFSFPDEFSQWNPDDYFPFPAGFDEPFVGFQGLNSTERDAAQTALDEWSHVANISFSEVDESGGATFVGDIRIAYTQGGLSPGNYAYAYTPAPFAFAGDVWLNGNTGALPPSAFDYFQGGNGFETLIHELGHTIGMDHPTSLPSFPKSMDSFKYTVMSYNDAPGHQDNGDSSMYPTTPMLLDIQAIQYLYGMNTSYNMGNDTYTFNEGGHYYQTIWDAGGNDTIVYNSMSDGAVIDLRVNSLSNAQFFFSQLGDAIHLSAGTNQDDDVAIAIGVVIENATGGAGADTITGNAVANLLRGNSGADKLAGAEGDDTLRGGPDGDTLAGDDGNDTLRGDTENDSLSGGLGNDMLDGGLGFDQMAGGAGNDVYVVNRGDGAGIAKLTGSEDAVTEAANGGFDTVQASTYTYSLNANVEDLVLVGSARKGFGNALDNHITGDAMVNTLDGGAGNDTLDGGAGNDRLTGGAGHDSFVFEDASSTDRINDFVAADDTIVLDKSGFASLTGTGILSDVNFALGAASDALDYIVYDSATGALYYDADGSGSGAPIQFATLIGAPAIGAEDFLVAA